MLNRAIIQGRMVRDAELRSLPSGKAVTSFTVACDRDFKSEAATDFIDIVAFAGTAEFVCKYLGKGRTILVDGRLQIREWTDKNGNKRRNAEIVAERVNFCDSKRDAAASAQIEDDYDTPAQLDDGYAELAGDGDLPF
jgi:single-strand DNA-binding protein